MCRLQTDSVGSSHIRSSRHIEAPTIRLNFLKEKTDLIHQINAVRKLREIFSQPQISDLLGDELQPLAGMESEAALIRGIKQSVESVHHPVGTCRMGVDENAVVSPELRVNGVDGLRIADASIMPRILSGNTHAACVMIGEKAADLVLKEKRPA